VKSALRFGLLYLLALLLLFAFGHRNQVERAHLAEMEAQLKKLKAEEEALLKEAWRLGRPLRVLEWAEEEGFVPMSEGRWNP
jgi:cell division protein FtsL